MATFRYIVADVGRAVAFYCDHLGFSVEQQFGPAIAILKGHGVTLWLAGPQASASRPMPDGRVPQPGGWNRFVLPVTDIAASVTKMKAAGVAFRNEIVVGPGGRQILCEDPSGNVIELFEASKER